MEFILIRFFALLSVAFVVSQAAVSIQDYWRSVLPNTPMPKSISELLPSLAAGGGAMNNKNYGAFAAGAGVIVNQIGRARNSDYGSGNIDYGNDNHHYGASASRSTIEGVFYFLQKDLHQEKNMNIHFTKFTTPTPFLARNLADSIPFSSKKLPEILSKFSVKQNTLASKIMKRTIDECEAPANKGEEKYCATSLESMIDFTTSQLGKRLNNVEAYSVSLVGNDGSKVRADVVCHLDTSTWNPKHVSFQVLHVKPGRSVSVCHFLERGSVLWVSY
ncbi:BURP domain-containing protein [Heracleum sosnowskyi]|uniref:BURP domain-containing protein n=1 Tax=Heracleum sosnowskyi TaxID=360622 RepID=A0AAD8HK08_9APIA|nr:BURP domain-containing protein [Heracleum sosnowskyi]